MAIFNIRRGFIPAYTIRLGSDVFNCPHCKAKGALTCVDGDSVCPELDGERPVADKLARSWRGSCYFATLNKFDCSACGREHARVVLCVVDNPEISRDWANAYFWMNERVPETPVDLTVEHSGMSWWASCMLTKEGLFALHHFEPMISREPLSGPYGMAACSGGSIWKEAAALAARMMPLVCDPNFHSECRRVMQLVVT